MPEQVEPIVIVAAPAGGHVEGLKASRDLLTASALFASEDRRRQHEQQEDEEENGYGYGEWSNGKFSPG
jgi:hypothetical protein